MLGGNIAKTLKKERVNASFLNILPCCKQNNNVVAVFL